MHSMMSKYWDAVNENRASWRVRIRLKYSSLLRIQRQESNVTNFNKIVQIYITEGCGTREVGNCLGWLLPGQSCCDGAHFDAATLVTFMPSSRAPETAK